MFDDHFKHLRRNCSHLVVFFHGAVNQEKTKTPHFVGLGFNKLLPFDTLHVADPTISRHKEMRTGLYLGYGEFNFQQIVYDRLQLLRHKYKYTTVVLFGSSGGGFLPLALASKYPDLKIVVNAPATTMINHPNKKIKQLFQDNIIRQSPDEKTYWAERIGCLRQGVEFQSPVVIISNVGDELNNKNHLEPFLAQFSAKSGDLNLGDNLVCHNLVIDRQDFGQGHKYPPVKYLADKLTFAAGKEIPTNKFSAAISRGLSLFKLFTK